MKCRLLRSRKHWNKLRTKRVKKLDPVVYSKILSKVGIVSMWCHFRYRTWVLNPSLGCQHPLWLRNCLTLPRCRPWLGDWRLHPSSSHWRSLGSWLALSELTSPFLRLGGGSGHVWEYLLSLQGVVSMGHACGWLVKMTFCPNLKLEHVHPINLHYYYY